MLWDQTEHACMETHLHYWSAAATCLMSEGVEEDKRAKKVEGGGSGMEALLAFGRLAGFDPRLNLHVHCENEAQCTCSQ